MNLYIETDSNGNPINHPAFEDNLLEVFGGIPEHWESFIRLEMPKPSVYQVLVSQDPTYQKINGVWTDVWALRDMTDSEKAAKQQAVKDAWNSEPRPNLTAWTFDEATCSYQPPTPKPNDGQEYFWQGTTNTWQIRPPYPTDGKQYKLDYPTATWVLVE
jgi:hypothetical protein